MNIFVNKEMEFCASVYMVDVDSNVYGDYTQLINELIEKNLFKKEKGNQFFLPISEFGSIVFFAYTKEMDNEKLRREFAKTVKTLQGIKVKNAKVLNADFDTSLILLDSGILSNYKFDKYLTKEKEYNGLENLVFFLEEFDEQKMLKIENLSKSVIIARDLVNEPSNVMLPKQLAKQIKELGEHFGFKVKVLDEDQIEKENMHAFLAVANASKNKPRFIILEHNGDKDSEYRFGLVGKGLTYDAGGLSIKPTNSMVSMKSDMAGSAAVAGVFCALAKNNVKANVTGVIAACENLISGTGYRPGDIINSRQGKTIFIGNTDAEGRLTLVDAIDYIIKEENVNEVIDIATLTGAAVASLGNTRTALFSNNDEMASIIEKVAIENGEPMWRMPIDDDYRELVKHHEADLTNSAGQPGAITAAIFLEKFTLDKSWAHLDIAGPSFYDKESGYIKKGGTGVGVKTLYNYIQNKING